MLNTGSWRIALLGAGLFLVQPEQARAQALGTPSLDHWVLVSVGGFVDDVNGDHAAPVAGLRAGMTFHRFFFGELTSGYSNTSTKSVNLNSFVVAETPTPFTHLDVNIGVQLPWVVTPYGSIGVGGFHRNGAPGIASQTGTGIVGAAGARITILTRLIVNGELRYREDRYSYGDVHNAEFTFGIGERF